MTKNAIAKPDRAAWQHTSFRSPDGWYAGFAPHTKGVKSPSGKVWKYDVHIWWDDTVPVGKFYSMVRPSVEEANRLIDQVRHKKDEAIAARDGENKAWADAAAYAIYRSRHGEPIEPHFKEVQ